MAVAGGVQYWAAGRDWEPVLHAKRRHSQQLTGAALPTFGSLLEFRLLAEPAVSDDVFGDSTQNLEVTEKNEFNTAPDHVK
jgi:hypothetical protein